MDITGFDSIDQMRQNYTAGRLDLPDVADHPMQQFMVWFQQAREACPVDWYEVNAANLATSDETGDVSNRVVLVKGIEDDGVVFYTNYDSVKGRQMAANPRVSLTFWWPFLQRQVRMAGTISKTTREKSIEYFHARPRGSQVGAAVSPQSEVVEDRQQLEQQVQAFVAEVGDGEIACPENWGGYHVKVNCVEFWQGRENRLHDRIQFLCDEGAWTKRRLAP